MKTVRVLLFVVVALVVLLLVAAVLALNSGFQTWAVRKAVADQAGAQITLGRVDAGLHQTRLDDITVRTPKATLTLPGVVAEVPLLAAARKDVNVKRLVAHGWTVDLTAAASAPAPAPGAAVQAAGTQAAAVFRGVFADLQLPVDLRVDEVDLEGDVVLPLAGAQPLRVHVKLTGGQLAAGATGQFVVEATSTLDEDSPVRMLRAHSIVTAAMDTPRTFSRVAVQTSLDASGPQLARTAHLTMDTAAERAVSGESYAANVASDGRMLFALRGAYPAGGNAITGTWEIAMSDADVAPYALGFALPQFTAKGAGKFATDANFQTLAASGQLDAATENLGTVRADLATIGALRLKADFDLVHEGGAAVRVNRLVAMVSGAQPVLHVEALQPFAFNPQTSELKIADPAKELLELTIDGMPVAWAQPLLSGFTITGSDVRGQFFLSPRNGGLSLRSRAPVTANGVSVAQGGITLLNALDISAAPTLDYTAQGWQAELANLTVRSGGATLVEVAARAGQLAGAGQPLKATGQWVVNLPALLVQPVLAGRLALTAGETRGDFAAAVDGQKELQARISLVKLAADPALKVNPLPAVTIDLRANLDAADKITFTAPIAVERQGRKSDLTLAGTLAAVNDQPVIDAQVTSDYVWLDDVQLLAAPLASSTAENQPAATPKGRDEKPFWAGVTGQVTLALKKVVYGADYELGNITGTLRIEPGAVRLEGTQATLGAESDVRAQGAVTFDAKAERPYVLQADVQLANFDPAPLFKAVAPNRPATVEGKFNATTKLNGEGANLDDLIERTGGNATLTSKGGRFRAISADLSDKVQKSSSTVAAIGGLIGAVTGKGQASEYANKTQVAADIAKALSDIAYDQLNVAVTRDAQLNFNVQDFSLIAPEVRLSGTGTVRHAENVPLLKSVIALSFQLGARGKLGERIKSIGLLDAKTDPLGYAAFNVPLKIGGTLENPDTGELQRALLNAALEKSSLLNGLLGK